VALTMMLVITVIGLVIAVLIPRQPAESAGPASSAGTTAPEAPGGHAS
jgi:preprotein translocase subunit SecG